jgi:hypothetical protein
LVCPDIIQDNLLNNESISHFRYHNSNNKVWLGLFGESFFTFDIQDKKFPKLTYNNQINFLDTCFDGNFITILFKK